MSDDPIDLERALTDIEDTLTDLEAVLAGEGESMAVISDYLAAGGSPEDGVDALLEWARAETDADIDAIEQAATEYLTEADAEDLSETPVAEFQSYLESKGDTEGDGDETPPEENPDVPPEEQEVTMEDLNSVKETVGTVAGALEDIKDMLSAREDQIEEQFGDLERRLSGIEDEPVKRSLAGKGPDEFWTEDEDGDGQKAHAHDDVYL